MGDIPAEVRAMKTSDLIAVLSTSAPVLHGKPELARDPDEAARARQYSKRMSYRRQCAAELDARIPPRGGEHG